MSTTVTLAVLFSAFMHAGWNFLIKSSRDKLVDAVALAVAGSLVAACGLPWLPLPAREAWPWLTLSVLIHSAYYLALVKSYQHADLSMAYPLMRGLAPVLLLAAAPLFGEARALPLVSGVSLIGMGLALPLLFGWQAGQRPATGLLFAVGTACLIALYTVLDGFGARLSGDVAAYTLWLFFFNSWGFLAVALRRRGRRLVGEVAGRARFALLGSVLTIGSYGIVLWAMQSAPIPAVAALRETSVIFAAVLGALFLREHMGRLRITGAILIACGAALVRMT
jgi:drug/metabolite transporter (DMT)-like permease